MFDKEKVTSCSIEKEQTLMFALRFMDQAQRRLLLVTDQGKYVGIVSSGDIQRAIIANKSVDTAVLDVLRSDITVASPDDSFDSIKAMMMEVRAEFMPVVDQAGKLVMVHFWEDVFNASKPEKKQFDIPVVIMAGGKGTRLKPFSNILPKPLFPLGEKTILEGIINRFCENGCNRFFLSVNYKADFIKSYLDQIEGRTFDIEVFQEQKPLGTAGSLSLLRGRLTEPFFVSNCDIIIDADYSEILEYHVSSRNEITVVAALKDIKIPYGTVVSGEEGQLKEFKEKPEISYMINSGMYLLNSVLLDEIPDNTFFHITELIEKVRNRGGRVGVFPVSEKSWSDIGEWQEYGKTLRSMGIAD